MNTSKCVHFIKTKNPLLGCNQNKGLEIKTQLNANKKRSNHTMNNNNFFRTLAILLAASTATLSAILTFNFMFAIGKDINSPALMGSMGLILDAGKTACPLFAIYLFAKQKHLSALLSSALALALIGISFCASVAAMQDSVIASKQQSTTYKTKTAQIAMYQQQVTDLRDLAKHQASIDQVSKSDITLSKILPLMQQITALSSDLTTSGDEKLINKYGMTIAYVCSLALELLSLVSSIMISATSTKRTHQMTDLSAHAVTRTQDTPTAQTPVNTGSQSHALTQTIAHALDGNTLNAEDVIFAAAVESGECMEQTKLSIKESIISREIKPSQRGVLSKYRGIARETINDVLVELQEGGVLRPYRNGFTYA